MQCFGKSLDQACNADLVDHLGQLAGAGFAKPRLHAGEAFDQRRGPGDSFFITADHDGELTVFRSRLAAGYRRIDKRKSQAGCSFVQLTGNFCRSGGVIDKNRARFHVRESAFGADRDRPQVVIVTHATEHEVCALRRSLGCRRGSTAVICHPSLGSCNGAIVDSDTVAGSGQVTGHRVAHHAQADKCDIKVHWYSCYYQFFSGNS